MKPTNPKDALAMDRVPLHLWPETATMLGALALFDGALKYGRANWRYAGARASVYVDACRRHLAAWFEGEDRDPNSGLHHLAHALACLAILVDAEAAGKMVDDRQVPGGFRQLRDALAAEVPRLRAMYADKGYTTAPPPISHDKKAMDHARGKASAPVLPHCGAWADEGAAIAPWLPEKPSRGAGDGGATSTARWSVSKRNTLRQDERDE